MTGYIAFYSLFIFILMEKTNCPYCDKQMYIYQQTVPEAILGVVWRLGVASIAVAIAYKIIN